MASYTKLNNVQEDEKPLNYSVQTVFKWTTEFNADSVEWCPLEPFKNIFVCGNYHLLPECEEADGSKKRIGRILLFSVNLDGLKLEKTVKSAAVLDQKWCHKKINDSVVLGIVTSNSKIELYTLNEESECLDLKKFSSYKFSNDSEDALLILSLDWSNYKFDLEPEIVCSDSKGRVHILKLTENDLVLKRSIVKFHEFETWIAGFYYWDANIFFSGGDDCILYKYDQRTGTEPVSINKSHEAGVTSLHSNISNEYILATGSYDERVRLWDIRNFKCPKSEIKTPGPLWRVKWDPFYQTNLLVASMLGGVHIISCSNQDKLRIIDSYYEHGNISYGIDWCFLSEEHVRNYPKDGNVMIASCSFYDNMLCVSKCKCDNIND